MSMHDEKVCLKIRLTEEEKAKLEHDAALCGLTQSEYLRQIWELLDVLYEVHDKLEGLAVYCPEMAEECSGVERLVLLLQEVEMGPPQSRSLALWGEEHPRNGELSPLAAEAMNGA